MNIQACRRALLASAVFLGATPAFAQDNGAREASGAGDIIVTARRSEERLQDVPISITVFSQEAITSRNVVTATDLATYTPSLAVNQRFGPEKAQFAIRGFNQGNSEAPTVGVYFADVVATRVQGGTAGGSNAPIGSFMDLQNVQVLKGPQGTLFGRNTTGGAVLLVPQKPTDNLEGYIQGSVGDYGMKRGEAVINLPLADTFKVRFAVDRNRRYGYMKNHLANGTRLSKKDDFNDVNYFAARMSIVADLTPNLENYTIATYSNSMGNSYGGHIMVCNNATTARGGALGVTATAACDQIRRQNARGDSPYDVEIRNYDPGLNIKTWSVINTTTWQASDSLTLKNIVSYSEYRERGQFSLNSDNFFISPNFTTGTLGPGVAPAGTAFNYISLRPVIGQDQAAESTFTEELQLQGNAGDGALTYQVGGYAEISNPIGFNAGATGILATCTTDGNAGCAATLGAASSISLSRTKFWFRDKGLYAQATYKLTDMLSVTGGIRYTWSNTRGLSRSTRLTLGDQVEACNDIVRFNLGVNPLSGRLRPLPVTDPARCDVTIRKNSGEPTWLLGIDFKPSDDLLLYGKYSRGYRAGGINLTTVGAEGWNPEFVDAFELGAKVSFSGAVNGYFNVAGFYNNLKDAQIAVSGISGVPGFSGAQPVINAGKARIQGIEADSSISPFDGLKIDLGYTFLKSKLVSIDPTLLVPPPGSPYAGLFVAPVVGNSLNQTPKHRLTLTGTYTLPLDESIGKISFGATYTYTAKQIITQATYDGVPRTVATATQPVNAPLYSNAVQPGTDFRFLPATNLVNLNVNWDNVMGAPIDLAFFVTNVTKEVYPVAVGSSWQSAGFENAILGAPRMFGFRAKYRFGN